MKPLNLFYAEPERDRWFPGDAYPRRMIRRLVRGKPRVGGQQRVFLNLCAGLQALGVPYRVNDYRYIQTHPAEVACIIGKPQVLDKIQWQNPILFGASLFSHPLHDPHLLERLPVKRVLVPGEWMRQMFEPFYGDRVLAWPVGIDTAQWQPAPDIPKDIDILLYDKVRWERDRYEPELIQPILHHLTQQGLAIARIRYGAYAESEFQTLLQRSKAMIFLCEHETQGLAYQQALSCDVPILAWDRGGCWQDPSFYPERVQFASVSSVPYWSDRCGVKFRHVEEFPSQLHQFFNQLQAGDFAPRSYILEHLTLEKCAAQYLDIYHQMQP